MKKVLIFAAVVLFANPVWALRFMGPPTPKSDSGQIGLGFDWSHSQFDIRSDDISVRPKPNMDNDIYFARLLLGVNEWVEISGSIGISDIEHDTEGGFRSGNDFAWGVGSKIKFWESGRTDLGAAFQLTSLTGDSETTTLLDQNISNPKLEAYVLELAVGPSYETHGVCLYGGPFVYFITGDIEGKRAGSGSEIDIEEEESEFGVYMGASAEIVKNTKASLEYHLTNDSWAIGAGIVHRFGRSNKHKNSSKAGSWSDTSKKKASAEKDFPKERLKTDESGKPVKDENGNFVFVTVE